MASRLELHNELIDILGTSNEQESRVYFQPPESVKLKYRCIKYSLSGIDSTHANDEIYRNINRYEIIVIDPDPDSTVHLEILKRFQMCRFDRIYTANNLNHFVLTLYY